MDGSDGACWNWLQSMLDPPVQLPLRMNNTPHPREMRQFFYQDVCESVKAAVAGGELKMSLRFVCQAASMSDSHIELGWCMLMSTVGECSGNKLSIGCTVESSCQLHLPIYCMCASDARFLKPTQKWMFSALGLFWS